MWLMWFVSHPNFKLNFFVYFQVHDGNSTNAPQLAKLCGNQLPSTINSSRNELYIKLRTDSSVSTGGFLASYTTSRKEQRHSHSLATWHPKTDYLVLFKIQFWIFKASNSLTEFMSKKITVFEIYTSVVRGYLQMLCLNVKLHIIKLAKMSFIILKMLLWVTYSSLCAFNCRLP